MASPVEIAKPCARRTARHRLPTGIATNRAPLVQQQTCEPLAVGAKSDYSSEYPRSDQCKRSENQAAAASRQVEPWNDAQEPTLHTKLLANLLTNRNLSPFVKFADDMQPYMNELVHIHFMVVEAEQVPSFCRLSDNRNANLWMMEVIAVDRLVLHVLLFAAQAYIQYKRTRSPAQSIDNTARHHLVKGLRLLRKTLDNTDQTTSDAPCLAINFLGIVAASLDDRDGARHHAKGLNKIVSMRGGLNQLGVLRQKSCRCDIGAAVACGSPPLFYFADMSWERCIEQSVNLADELGLKTLLCYLNSRLTAAWADLRWVSIIANQTDPEDKATKYDISTFQDIMISILYRLLHLRCSQKGPEEAVRLAAIVFSSSLFLQFHGNIFAFTQLSEDLQNALMKLPKRYEKESPSAKLALWMQFMAVVALGSDKEKIQPLVPYVKARIENTKALSWTSVRQILKSLLWVECVHDDLGVYVYNEVLKV